MDIQILFNILVKANKQQLHMHRRGTTIISSVELVFGAMWTGHNGRLDERHYSCNVLAGACANKIPTAATDRPLVRTVQSR